MKEFAKTMMRMWPSPAPSADDLSLNEIFRHDNYLKAGDERQAEIRRASSLHRYDEEERKPFFLTYFKDYKPEGDERPNVEHGFVWHLYGRHVFDFGCFTGGRGVRWARQYGIAKLYGTDINPIYIRAAAEFAEAHAVPNDYRVLEEDGRLPFPDSCVDTVVTFDVLEHVNDLRLALDEMTRILKPGGVMFVVFPSFYNPLEAHLDLATRMPALQWLFSGRTLTSAYHEMLGERDGGADWYRPGASSDWEKLPTLNGTTARSFKRLLKSLPLRVLHETRTPIMTQGSSYASLRKAVIKPALSAALALRVFDDLLLDRVALVLRKE